jgi:hypothetical protein
MSSFNHVNFFSRWRVAVPTTGAIGASLLAAMAGCSGGPSTIKPPSISASGAASEAMEIYDKDGDGFIAGPELDAASGLKAAMKTLDTDSDGKASEDEIVKRIEAWQASGVGIAKCSGVVTLDGKPLAGATVTFEPEPFLSDALKPAISRTTAMGAISPSIPKEERVPADAPPGLMLGFYKVKVSKQEGGSERIPAKYNAETILGQQVAPDDEAMAAQRVRFELKSK